MTKKIWVSYVMYFFSYTLVYPLFYIPLLLLAFGAFLIPEQKQEDVFNAFYIFVTLFWAIFLNYFFRKSMELQKNKKYTLAIFFSHLILIPTTYIIVLFLM